MNFAFQNERKNIKEKEQSLMFHILGLKLERIFELQLFGYILCYQRLQLQFDILGFDKLGKHCAIFFSRVIQPLLELYD